MNLNVFFIKFTKNKKVSILSDKISTDDSVCLIGLSETLWSRRETGDVNTPALYTKTLGPFNDFVCLLKGLKGDFKSESTVFLPD